MAGDWIKLRKCVITHPRLVRTMSALNADRLRTLGGIVSAWCLLDEQTSDGKLEGYTPEILDELVGLQGLSRAMEAAGWLIITESGLQAPEFEKHNGSTAKRRAQESDRKMSARNADKCPQPKQTNCGPEKRREKKNNSKPQHSDEEWLAALEQNPAFSHVNIQSELQRAQTWIQKQNGRRAFTRKFFEKWLSNAEKPLTLQIKELPPSQRY